jgi:hypothetical protein
MPCGTATLGIFGDEFALFGRRCKAHRHEYMYTFGVIHDTVL